jgi:parallel beta-helix repeat protein
MLCGGKWRLYLVIFIVAVLCSGVIPLYYDQIIPTSSAQPIEQINELQQALTSETIQKSNIQEVSNNISAVSTEPTTSLPVAPVLAPTKKPAIVSSGPLPLPQDFNYGNDQNSIEEIQIDNSSYLQAAINALGPNGGEVTLNSDVTLFSKDVQIKSNTILSGINLNIIMHLDSKRLNIPKDVVNVTIKNMIFEASELGDRSAFVVNEGAQDVVLEDLVVQNDYSNKSAIVTFGNNTQIQNVTFNNIPNAHPVQISASHAILENCRSKDESTQALVTVGGGITDVHINGNTAQNRPLFDGGYTIVSSSDIWITNNRLLNFPNRTYGILVMGGTLEPMRAPFDRVFVVGNFIKSGIAAYNAIAIYGMSSNVLVANNTVDQTLSGHNAIGVASGVNVTVTQNTVFGCIEGGEGGIEVESNPVHNRFTGISENVNITQNFIYGSQWGIYVRIMVPDHINWADNPLPSRNIRITGNTVTTCTVGINLLNCDNIVVRDNSLIKNTFSLWVDKSKVSNYTIIGNVGCIDSWS